MTDKAKLYFDHFIKHGFNHADFPEESIREIDTLIFHELMAVKHKLPRQLRKQTEPKIFARELAEIAIVVQGYAIHHFKLHPANEMFIQNTNGPKPNDEIKHKNIRWTATDLEIQSSIVFLRGLIKKLWVNGIKQESVSLIIGNNEIPVPKELRFQTAASLLLLENPV
jgi:hypothetical protein